MQYQLSAGKPEASAVAAALRKLDPNVQVALDAARGRLEVLAIVTHAQVQDVLQGMGCVATPLAAEVHISGGSSCCGHCG